MSNSEDRLKSIETLVMDCIWAHQEAIIVKLIAQLEEDYAELAKIVTMGEYKASWTHKRLIDYICKEL